MKKRSKVLLLTSALLGGVVLSTAVSCGDGPVAPQEEKTYNIATPIITPKEGGEFKINPSNATGKVGKVVPFIVLVNNGYELESIVVNGEALPKDAKNFTPKEGTNTIKVTFKKIETKPDVPDQPTVKKGTVTVGELVGGTITPSITEGEVGKEVTLDVKADETHTIGEVKVNDVVITPVDGVYKFTLVEGANTVTATFIEKTPVAKTGTVTVGTLEGGTITPSVTEGEVGKEVILDVKADDTHTIGEVKVNGKVIAPVEGVYKFEIAEGVNEVTATFNVKTPEAKTGTVTIATLVGGTITPSITEGTVGTEVILTVKADETHTVSEVKVNEKTITPVDGVYKFIIEEGENKVTATFNEKTPEAKTGTVTVTELVGGTITPSATEGTVGTEITLTVEPDETHEIGEVKVNDKVLEPVDGVYKFALVEGTNTVTATFTEKAGPIEKTGTVTIDQPVGGTVTPSATEGKVGTEITLTIKADESHTIGEAKVNDTVINPVDGVYKFLLAEGENKVTVTFNEKTPEAKTGTVSIGTFTGGKVEASATEGEVGTEITLTVTPDTDYTIGEVKVNETVITPKDGAYKFTLVEGTNTVTATFNEIKKTGTVTVSELVGGTITPSITEGEVGTEVTLTVKADATHEIGEVKVNDTVITPVEGVYKFALVEGTNTVTATFTEKAAEPIASKELFIETYNWFDKDYAKVGVKAFDSNGKALVEGKFGVAATHRGFNEVDKSNIWTFTTPENTASIVLYRTNGTLDTDWGAHTKSLSIKADIGENNMIRFSKTEVWGETPVTFDTIDASNPIPTFPSLGVYTFNIKVDETWTKSIEAGNKVYLHRASFYDGSLNNTYPGLDITNEIKGGTYTFEGEVKRNSVFLLTDGNDNGLKTNDIVLPYEAVYKDTKSIDVNVTGKEFTHCATGTTPEVEQTTKFTLKMPGFWFDAEAKTNVKFYLDNSDAAQNGEVVLDPVAVGPDGLCYLDVEIPNSAKWIIINRNNPSDSTQHWNFTDRFSIEEARTNGNTMITLSDAGNGKFAPSFSKFEAPVEARYIYFQDAGWWHNGGGKVAIILYDENDNELGRYRMEHVAWNQEAYSNILRYNLNDCPNAAKVQFLRTNDGTGEILNWGASTAIVAIPDLKTSDLFVLNTKTEVWGAGKAPYKLAKYQENVFVPIG